MPYGERSSPQEIRLRYQLIRDQIIRLDRRGVLEVGCGNGSLSRAIEDIVEKYVGIDISRHAIQLARQTSKNGEFLVASVCALPFRSESQKLVLCSEVLEHVPDYWIAIREISRVLETDGYIVATTPNHMNPSVLLSSFYSRVKGVSRTSQIYDKPVHRRHLLSTLHACGMKVNHIDSFYSYFTSPSLSPKRVFQITLEQLIKIFAILTRRPYKLYLLLVAWKKERY